MEDVVDSVMKLVVDSPSVAIWVLAIIYGFKVVVVGSIYGTIRFVVAKIHDAWVAPKNQTVTYKFPNRTNLINEEAKQHMDDLISMLSTEGRYIHACDLRKALAMLKEAKFKTN
jgi:hypothetical protein